MIPLPVGEQGLKEQRKIAKILEQADEAVRNYGPILDAQQALKRSLMHDLLTGKVRVNNLNLDGIAAA
jgi:type I restriction enzyme S subunit